MTHIIDGHGVQRLIPNRRLVSEQLQIDDARWPLVEVDVIIEAKFREPHDHATLENCTMLPLGSRR